MPINLVQTSVPSTEIKDHLIVASPFIAKGNIAFKGSTEVSLQNVDKEASIYYTLGDDFQKYEQPFTISDKATLKVYAKKGQTKSTVITTDFYKIDPNLKIELDVDSLKELENAFNIEKLEKMLEETANKGEVEFKITCNKPAVKPNGVKRKISYNIKSENLHRKFSLFHFNTRYYNLILIYRKLYSIQ